jgi:hypothetical protein
VSPQSGEPRAAERGLRGAPASNTKIQVHYTVYYMSFGFYVSFGSLHFATAILQLSLSSELQHHDLQTVHECTKENIKICTFARCGSKKRTMLLKDT